MHLLPSIRDAVQRGIGEIRENSNDADSIDYVKQEAWRAEMEKSVTCNHSGLQHNGEVVQRSQENAGRPNPKRHT